MCLVTGIQLIKMLHSSYKNRNVMIWEMSNIDFICYSMRFMLCEFCNFLMILKFSCGYYPTTSVLVVVYHDATRSRFIFDLYLLEQVMEILTKINLNIYV